MVERRCVRCFECYGKRGYEVEGEKGRAREQKVKKNPDRRVGFSGWSADKITIKALKRDNLGGAGKHLSRGL